MLAFTHLISTPTRKNVFLPATVPAVLSEVVLQTVLGLEIWTEVILCWLAPEQAGHRQNGQLVSRIVLCLSVADVAACFIFCCFEFAQKVELGAALQTGMAALHQHLKRE